MPCAVEIPGCGEGDGCTGCEPFHTTPEHGVIVSVLFFFGKNLSSWFRDR